MNKTSFNYRIYGRSKGRYKKNIKYDKFNLILSKFAIKDLNTNNHNILDIGSGYGENSLFLAENYSEAKVIACENFFDGNYKLVTESEKKSLENLFIYNGNVNEFLDKLTINKYFNSVWILFPDPWPKKRHLKRRLLNMMFFNKIHKYLKDNGSLNIATDSQPYLLNILYLITHLKKQYIWENQRKLDWDYQNISLVQTKYYKKAIKNGSNPFFIKLRKL